MDVSVAMESMFSPHAHSALWKSAVNPSCPVNPGPKNRCLQLHTGLQRSTMVCPTTTSPKFPLPGITGNPQLTYGCSLNPLQFLNFFEMSTPEQDASEAKNPKNCSL